MTYELVLTHEALQHFEDWGKSSQQKTLNKLAGLFQELREHPSTGTGQVEQLKGNLSGLWSRRITRADWLIYKIEHQQVIVTVISAQGHYGDK